MSSQVQALLMIRGGGPYVFVNKTNSASGSATCPALPLTTGNAIFVTANWFRSAPGSLGSCDAINDTAGNIYTALPSATNTDRSGCRIFYCLNANGNGSNVVTGTFSGGAIGTMINTVQMSGGYRIFQNSVNVSPAGTTQNPISSGLFNIQYATGTIISVASCTVNDANNCFWSTNVVGDANIIPITVAIAYSGYAAYNNYFNFGGGGGIDKVIFMDRQPDWHAMANAIFI